MAGESDGDPFDWDAELLIKELCGDQRPWAPAVLSRRPDPESLAKALRENDMDGETLLSWEDVFKSLDGLFRDLGVARPAHRMTLARAIVYLKKRSPKYRKARAQYAAENEIDVSEDLDVNPTKLGRAATPTPITTTITNTTGPATAISNEPPTESPTANGHSQDDVLQNDLLQKELWQDASDRHPSPPREPSPHHHPHAADEPEPPHAPERPPKKRRLAPQLVSATVSAGPRAPIPTAADSLSVLPGRSIESLDYRTRSTYLGSGKLITSELVPRSMASVSNNGQSSAEDSSVEFAWARSRSIPPGRRLQVHRAMRRLQRSNDNTLRQIKNGFAPFVERPETPEGASEDGVLPIFGDSGDEGGYDSETLREMDEEEAEAREDAPSNKLSKDRVDAILEDAIQGYIDAWTESKLPKYQWKANRLWNQARRRDRNREIMKSATRVAELNARIQKLCAEIRIQDWPKEDHLRRQARCLEPSVDDRQYYSWLVDILKGREPPRAPRVSRPAHRKVTQPKDATVSDEDGEVITSDSEPSEDDFDFIVPNTVDSEPDQRGPSPEADASQPMDLDTPEPEEKAAAASPAPKMEFSSPSKSVVIDLTQPSGPRLRPDKNVEYIDLVTPEKPRQPRPPGTSSQSPQELDPSSDEWDLPFDQPEAIGAVSCRKWAKRKDHRRLTICFLWRRQEPWRDVIFELIKAESPDNLWQEFVSSVLDSDEAEEEAEEGNTLDPKVIIPRLFWQYAFCKYRRKLFKIESSAFSDVLDMKEEFDEFCDFLRQHVIPHFPASAMSPDDDMLSDVDEEDAEDADGDRASASPSKQAQKRKRRFVMDQQAKDWRESDKRRVEEQEERRRQLQARLASSSAISRDKSRLIINTSKEGDDDRGLIYVHEHVAPKIKDHQIEGVRFMWNQIVVGQGCLLAHTMGLGKTMQIVTLLVTIAEASRSPEPAIRSQIPERLRQSKTLVLCPSGLVDNWMDELMMWTPKGCLGNFFRVDSTMSQGDRWLIPKRWSSEGGVFVVGYEMFRSIIDDEEIDKIFTEEPNIVVADEAHRMKNPNSTLHVAAARFRTKCRLALTGSPLANNVQEFYAMIDWVAPRYLGPAKEFKNVYSEPIHTGLWGDSTPYQFRKAKKMLAALERTVAPKTHRLTIKALAGELPEKKEFVISVPLTDLQEKLYKLFIDRSQDEGGAMKTFARMSCLSLLCNHPRIFYEKVLQEKKEQEAKKGSAGHGSGSGSGSGGGGSASMSLAFMTECAKVLKRQVDLGSIDLSWKVKMLVTILDQCRRMKEKVLIFSQSIPTLDYLDNLFRQQKRLFSRLTGDTNSSLRQRLVREFNEGDREIFLISTNAGGVGLNICGASRVVIFDFKFNPVSEQQAIGRAYRIGQTKPVFVYRFIAGGTFEQRLQHTAVFKMQLSSRVVDQENPKRWSQKLGEFLKHYEEPPQETLVPFRGKDVVLDSLLSNPTLRNVVRSIVLTDTFEEEDPNDIDLDSEEKKEVENMIRMNQIRESDPEEYRRLEMELEQRERQLQYGAMANPSGGVFGQPAGGPLMASTIPLGHPSTLGTAAAAAAAAPGPGPGPGPLSMIQRRVATPLSGILKRALGLPIDGTVQSGVGTPSDIPSQAPEPQPGPGSPPQMTMTAAGTPPTGPAPSPLAMPIAGRNTSMSARQDDSWASRSTPLKAPAAASRSPEAPASGPAGSTRNPDIQEQIVVFEGYLGHALLLRIDKADYVPPGLDVSGERVSAVSGSIQALLAPLGSLPCLSQWKSLNKLASKSRRFTVALLSGLVAPDFAAKALDEDLQQRVETLEQMDAAEFRDEAGKAMQRPQDPNNLGHVLHRSASVTEAEGTRRNPQAEEDLQVMRELAARRQRRQPKLPSWANRAVEDQQ
ncbi:hypothetical protein SODALDRAFT_333416 [Sodiomyces alkalinus F11]|uniref:Uncharacterized protein n=1 Tax=Sodiomyces alkalinus (strain CBS 110278 / VKM F-3762 / F11) TaxID=1314773 RepID=A0A3N2PWA3_SODAK|nr:hypothetical protein SODALDRAFT_333416 [Sodiomyces alkalinus F11]ROT38793.1 hypothetical protein SODALDRAFT_333416 [Sodiomyces alkalinus F11]